MATGLAIEEANETQSNVQDSIGLFQEETKENDQVPSHDSGLVNRKPIIIEPGLWDVGEDGDLGIGSVELETDQRIDDNNFRNYIDCQGSNCQIVINVYHYPVSTFHCRGLTGFRAKQCRNNVYFMKFANCVGNGCNVSQIGHEPVNNDTNIDE